MQLYLAASPDRLAEARRYAVGTAHAAYRIGEASHLTALPLPTRLQGGLMLLSDREAPPVQEPEVLCRDILQTCRDRRYGGVVLDFEAPPVADRTRLVRQLDDLLPRRQLQLFVPERWAACTRQAAVVVCTALSGGSLRLRLQEVVDRFAPRCVVLDCQRLAMDFLLPTPNGEGAPLTMQELRRLQQGRSIYFSEDLCARYFTCSAGRHTRFVLFDDADTLRRKLQLAEELGISAAFFMLPEIEDLLDALFPRRDTPSG
ncbi:MAG: hypothetical protein E7426_00805 [Ruminococcaceae bacterium]|nr:hypothetical protein [Oscillospiraceae bacterium]